MRFSTSFVLAAIAASQLSGVFALPMNLASSDVSVVERDVDGTPEYDARDFEDVEEYDARDFEDAEEFEARDTPTPAAATPAAVTPAVQSTVGVVQPTVASGSGVNTAPGLQQTGVSPQLGTTTGSSGTTPSISTTGPRRRRPNSVGRRRKLGKGWKKPKGIRAKDLKKKNRTRKNRLRRNWINRRGKKGKLGSFRRRRGDKPNSPSWRSRKHLSQSTYNEGRVGNTDIPKPVPTPTFQTAIPNPPQGQNVPVASKGTN